MQVFVERTARAYADNVFDVVKIVQFIRINADCGLSHTGSHNRHSLALVIAGVAVDASYVVDQSGVFKKIFRNKFGAKRIARHKNGICEITEFCRNVWGWN